MTIAGQEIQPRLNALVLDHELIPEDLPAEAADLLAHLGHVVTDIHPVNVRNQSRIDEDVLGVILPLLDITDELGELFDVVLGDLDGLDNERLTDIGGEFHGVPFDSDVNG